ncbi:MAG: flagellar hook-length control protein FliK [Bdellovibrionaceae bacterium]|nr:flagellar hook-length control protein FliK [Pseudobdellovibrionaceae bacterium]
MNQVMPAKTLDLKPSKAVNTAKKKANDEGFRKELDEKEKKTSDRDQLSASHHNDIDKRQNLKKNSEPSRSALRNKVNETKGKDAKATEKKSSVVETKSTGNAEQTQAANSEAAPVQQQQVLTPEQTKAVSEASVAAQVTDTAQMEALQKIQMAQKFTSEGIALDGMTLVNPEAVNANLLNPVGETSTTASVPETSAMVAPLAEAQGKSLEADLGNGSEGNLGDLKADPLNDALNSALQVNAKNKDLAFDAALKTATGAPTESVREANVDNLVQSARTLLRDGGGEMKIILNPEGLGTVDLKVGVQGSEVSIEIIAQDNNVKKMFEDGLSDIRGALELQNLKMDSFKVDVSQRAEQNLMEQQQQQQEGMNREFARDFMNQFRGERQAFRNQSVGYDMERSPDFSKSPEGLRPAQNNIGANGRLNIVA